MTQIRNVLSVAGLVLVAGSGCSQGPGALFSETSGGGATAMGSGGLVSSSSGAPSSGGSELGSVSGGASNGGASISTSGGSPAAGASGSNPGGAPSGGAPSGGASSYAAGTGGTAAPSACDGKVVPAMALIADFEAGVVGWSGYIGQQAVPVLSSEPGAAMTAHAATFSGGPATTSGMFFPLPCHDVSSFDGISFWAKGRGGDHVRFLAVIPATDPTLGVGDCLPASMTCSDHPGKLFTFTADWVLYRAAWAELKQYGWGSKATFAGIINAVLWINDGPVQSFDFSIDEVKLYQAAAPL